MEVSAFIALLGAVIAAAAIRAGRRKEAHAVTAESALAPAGAEAARETA